MLSKGFSNLLLPFLCSSALLTYGRHLLEVTNLNILLQLYKIYLAFVGYIFSICKYHYPVFVIFEIKPFTGFDIFVSLAKFPGFFKHLLLYFYLVVTVVSFIFGLIKIEKKSIIMLSFEKDSFKYLDVLRENKIKDHKMKQKIDQWEKGKRMN